MPDTYNNVVVTSPENAAREKGRQMWQCLDALAAYYEHADMRKISATSRFVDDKWDVPGVAQYNFLWNSWLPEPEYFPLLTVCKVVVYHEINTLNKKVSTVRPYIGAFISTFKALFASKGILVANRDQPFQNLSYLALEDVLHLAQMGFAQNRTINITALYGLNSLASCPLSALPDAEFMIAGSRSCLPWSGTFVIKWVEATRVALLKQEGVSDDSIAELMKVRSYPPLKLGVMESLVQASMPFVDEHFALIKKVFDIIEAEKGKGTLHRPIDHSTRAKIERRYGKELDGILPLMHITENDKKVISITWFKDLEQLVQGAVAWLILLTTGLRNKDMRNLVIGCCRPSKRFDLLNYLITDIKKPTSLTILSPCRRLLLKPSSSLPWPNEIAPGICY